MAGAFSVLRDEFKIDYSLNLAGKLPIFHYLDYLDYLDYFPIVPRSFKCPVRKFLPFNTY